MAMLSLPTGLSCYVSRTWCHPPAQPYRFQTLKPVNAILCARWESKTRYYKATLSQDLFGDWTLVHAWGGKTNRLGHYHVAYVPSYAAGLDSLARLHQLRCRRGYHNIAIMH